jgi:hypothetical protein
MQAGEFVREEIHHVREGKHGARSAKQSIAIGLSKARRARATMNALRREGRQSASSSALSRQAKLADSKRTRKERSAAGKKAAKTRARRRWSSRKRSVWGT